MVSGLQLWPCCLYHVQSDTVSVQVHAFPWNYVEYVIAKDVEQQLESRGKQQKPYRDKIVHCFTCRSQLISPSYHPECQLTAFPKSFRFLCCTGSVYFWGFVFGSWPRGEYSFLRHTWLAGYCTSELTTLSTDSGNQWMLIRKSDLLWINKMLEAILERKLESFAQWGSVHYSCASFLLGVCKLYIRSELLIHLSNICVNSGSLGSPGVSVK